MNKKLLTTTQTNLNGYSISSIVADMNNHHKESKFSNGSSYEQIAKEYIDVCVMELLEHANTDQQITTISLSNIRERLKYRYNRSKLWLDFFYTNYPLWIETKKGYFIKANNYEYTQIKPLVSVKELVNYRLSQSFRHLFADNKGKNSLGIPIDITSLENFIVTSMQQPRVNVKHVAQACNILDRQQHGVVYDCISVTNNCFGASRLYHIGSSNMQGISSVVREAALGDCVKYDINTAVFTYIQNVIKTMEPDAKTPYLMEIITEKSQVRERLVTECIQDTVTTPEHALKMIKSAITALSFGASPSNSQGGIAKAIMSKNDLLRFGMNPFIKGLRREIKIYNKHIRKSVKQGKMATISSHHYQYTESQCILDIVNNIQADILMTVHDCVYTKTSVTNPIDMQRILEKHFGQYAKMERKDISAWQNRSGWQHNEQLVQLHRQNIQQEERRARKYTSANSITQISQYSDNFDQRLQLKADWQEITKNHA